MSPRSSISIVAEASARTVAAARAADEDGVDLVHVCDIQPAEVIRATRSGGV